MKVNLRDGRVSASDGEDWAQTCVVRRARKPISRMRIDDLLLCNFRREVYIRIPIARIPGWPRPVTPPSKL
jgi:hypothetical protein